MYCPKCGLKNKIKARFCRRCGTSLTTENSIKKTTEIFTPPLEEEKVEISLEPQKEPVLVVAKGPMVGERFSLNKKETTLGRDPQSDIFLNDITVSRKHAQIEMGQKKVVLTDVGSLNGTYVNQTRSDEAVLKHGDELQIGRFKLIFLARK